MEQELAAKELAFFNFKVKSGALKKSHHPSGRSEGCTGFS